VWTDRKARVTDGMSIGGGGSEGEQEAEREFDYIRNNNNFILSSLTTFY
jgi:hypothetical protein